MTVTSASRDIELWLVDLVGTSTLLLAAEARKPRLSDDDRQRLQALTHPRVRSQRELSWIALRLAIARAAGDGRYDGVAFQRSANGKPFLADRGVTFSLSHSGGFALVAATANPVRAFGVDLQESVPLRMSTERRARIVQAGALIAGRVRERGNDDAGNDVAGNDAAGKDEAIRAFVRIEAVAKATGLGLAHVLARLGVIAASKAGDAATREADERFSEALADLDVRDIDLGRTAFAATTAAMRLHAAIAATRGVLRGQPALTCLPWDAARLDV